MTSPTRPPGQRHGSAHERPRILVVEDHWLVAMQAQLMLEENDCEVVGPVGTVADASCLAMECDLSGAILDIGLGDATSFPIADILAERNIPFAFASGYSAVSLPVKFAGRPHFDKPYDGEMVARFLEVIEVRRHAIDL